MIDEERAGRRWLLFLQNVASPRILSIKTREQCSLPIHICVVLVLTFNCKCEGQSHGNCARG